MNKWSEIYFLDNDLSKSEILGLNVIDSVTNFEKFVNSYDFFVAIGNNTVRAELTSKIEEYKANIATLIAPSANIGLGVNIGCGTVIMPGASINSEAQLRNGVIINTNATVDHDCSVGDFVHISPGVNIAGSVSIGNLTWIGIGAQVINNISISQKVIVGAGATVINNIHDNCVVVGTPAKPIK